MNGWAAFWLVIAAFVVCDFLVFRSGCDSTFWKYSQNKPFEMEVQKKIVGDK